MKPFPTLPNLPTFLSCDQLWFEHKPGEKIPYDGLSRITAPLATAYAMKGAAFVMHFVAQLLEKA